eukprot:GGOE01018946.1.p1 GENE.GGOE01018946.1~~GGOE01018946.1.p1  ORF type:complete len:405 (+),score=73.97 GGOE01018946.1:89-1303(+)
MSKEPKAKDAGEVSSDESNTGLTLTLEEWLMANIFGGIGAQLSMLQCPSLTDEKKVKEKKERKQKREKRETNEQQKKRKWKQHGNREGKEKKKQDTETASASRHRSEGSDRSETSSEAFSDSPPSTAEEAVHGTYGQQQLEDTSNGDVPQPRNNADGHGADAASLRESRPPPVSPKDHAADFGMELEAFLQEEDVQTGQNQEGNYGLRHPGLDPKKGVQPHNVPERDPERAEETDHAERWQALERERLEQFELERQRQHAEWQRREGQLRSRGTAARDKGRPTFEVRRRDEVARSRQTDREIKDRSSDAVGRRRDAQSWARAMERPLREQGGRFPAAPPSCSAILDYKDPLGPRGLSSRLDLTTPVGPSGCDSVVEPSRSDTPKQRLREGKRASDMTFEELLNT